MSLFLFTCIVVSCWAVAEKCLLVFLCSSVAINQLWLLVSETSIFLQFMVLGQKYFVKTSSNSHLDNFCSSSIFSCCPPDTLHVFLPRLHLIQQRTWFDRSQNWHSYTNLRKLHACGAHFSEGNYHNRVAVRKSLKRMTVQYHHQLN